MDKIYTYIYIYIYILMYLRSITDILHLLPLALSLSYIYNEEEFFSSLPFVQNYGFFKNHIVFQSHRSK